MLIGNFIAIIAGVLGILGYFGFAKVAKTSHKIQIAVICVIVVVLLAVVVNNSLLLAHLIGSDIYWRTCLNPAFSCPEGVFVQAFEVVNGTSCETERGFHIDIIVNTDQNIVVYDAKGVRKSKYHNTCLDNIVIKSDLNNKDLTVEELGGEYDQTIRTVRIENKSMSLQPFEQYQAFVIYGLRTDPNGGKYKNPLINRIMLEIGGTQYPGKDGRIWAHRHPIKTYFIEGTFFLFAFGVIGMWAFKVKNSIVAYKMNVDEKDMDKQSFFSPFMS